MSESRKRPWYPPKEDNPREAEMDFDVWLAEALEKVDELAEPRDEMSEDLARACGFEPDLANKQVLPDGGFRKIPVRYE